MSVEMSVINDRTEEGKGSKEHILYLDVLRIVACFLVIVNHTNSGIFLNSSPSKTWFVSLAYFFISKVAVPLFLMISGVVLLRKEDSYRKIGQRVLRTIVTLLLFSLLYYVDYVKRNHTVFDIKNFLYTVYHGPITNAYWYLYLYLGILAMLPLLQRLNKGMKKKDYLFLFTVTLIFQGIAPILTHYFEGLRFDGYFEMTLINSYVVMLFVGYYIEHYVTVRRPTAVFALLMLLLTILGNVILTYREYLSVPDGSDYLFLDNNTDAVIVIPSICVFILVKYFCDRFPPSERVQHSLNELGHCTFGIYLLSDFFARLLKNVNQFLVLYMHPLIAVVFYELIIFITGLATTLILRRTPGIKKLL